MLQAAIEKAKSTEPTKIGAALGSMKINVYDGGEGMMRGGRSSVHPALYISSFGERSAKEPFDEENTGWAGSSRADRSRQYRASTTCKMSRPAS